MTILITYPREKIPAGWRQKLEKKNKVLYLPFRVLKASKLSDSDKKTIAKSSALAITSLFGAEVYSRYLARINPAATIYVLSKKIGDQLKGKVANTFHIAQAENRLSLLAKLKKDEVTACWLIGDQAEKYYSDFPGQKVIIYRNTWDETHEQRAFQLLAKKQITSALVTSPSNFDRMIRVLNRMDGNNYQKIHYFVLGKGTGQYLRQKGLHVTIPKSKEKVLVKALSQLWQYEKERLNEV